MDDPHPVRVDRSEQAQGLAAILPMADQEEDLELSPLDRVLQPKTEQQLIPILGDEDTAKILATCDGKDFLSLRDGAIIRGVEWVSQAR